MGYTVIWCLLFIFNMIAIGIFRAYFGKNSVFPSFYSRNQKIQDLHAFTDAMGIILYFLMIIFGFFFSYFAFDFLDDFLKGVNNNQTTVENYKDIWGANFTRRDNYKLYIGKTWYDYLFPFR